MTPHIQGHLSKTEGRLPDSLGDRGGQKALGQYIQGAERKKKNQLRLLYPAKLSFKTAGEIKTCPDKQKHMLLAKSLKGSSSG